MGVKGRWSYGLILEGGLSDLRLRITAIKGAGNFVIDLARVRVD